MSVAERKQVWLLFKNFVPFVSKRTKFLSSPPPQRKLKHLRGRISPTKSARSFINPRDTREGKRGRLLYFDRRNIRIAWNEKLFLFRRGGVANRATLKRNPVLPLLLKITRVYQRGMESHQGLVSSRATCIFKVLKRGKIQSIRNKEKRKFQNRWQKGTLNNRLIIICKFRSKIYIYIYNIFQIIARKRKSEETHFVMQYRWNNKKKR